MGPARGGEGAGRGDRSGTDGSGGGRPTLGQEGRARARERIVQGAVAMLATEGLDATVDEVARASGVSRRTVFRHFATHGELFAAAISEGWRAGGARPPDPPAPGTDVEAWLASSSVSLHEMNRRVVGRAFWDIHGERPGMPPEVAAALADLTMRRNRYAHELAIATWLAMGGEGVPPPWVVDAFALQISSFATNALAHYDTAEAGQVCARILWAVLSTALAESRAGNQAG